MDQVESATSPRTTSTGGAGRPSAKPGKPGSNRHAYAGSSIIEINTSSNPTGDPTMSF